MVLVLALVCGLQWAKETYPSSWRTEKLEGKVSAKSGSKWTVKFDDDFTVNLNRGEITFKHRPDGDTGAERGAEHGAERGAERGEAYQEVLDSSDEEGAAEEPEDEADDEISGDHDGPEPDTVDGWHADDDASIGQRALSGQTNRNQPTYNLPDYQSKEIWDYALHCWEVTVFKHCTYFHPRYKPASDGTRNLSHQRFRVLLAYTLLTGGLSADNASPERPLRVTSASTSAVVTSPGQGQKKHQFTQFANHKKHQCAYCAKGTMAYTVCETCVGEGVPCMAFCSFTTGRSCQDKHRRGYPPLHTMHTIPTKSTGKEPARPRNKRGPSSADLESLRRSQRANFGSPGRSCDPA